VQHVAFIRNVNQGQGGHPSTADLVGAFVDAGCPDAVAFQSNGTIVFETDDPDAAIADALAALEARSGIAREGFGMPLSDLARIVEAHAGEPEGHRRELTLHTGGVIAASDPDVMREAAHRRCRVVDAGPGWAVLLNERDRESNGTPVVERLTGARATSRGIPTLTRLVDRFAR
jgi:uncharacterized protein (DUF1697 family)